MEQAILHPASKTSVSLAHARVKSGVVKERLVCMNQVKSLLSMCRLVLGYSFEARLNSLSLDTAGVSVMTFGLSAINTDIDARTLNTSLTRETTRLTS